jgi:hypothetical protein
MERMRSEKITIHKTHLKWALGIFTKVLFFFLLILQGINGSGPENNFKEARQAA